MKWFNTFFLCFCLSGFAQDSIQVTPLNNIKLKIETLVNIDNFGTIYYTKGNILYKVSNDKSINYSNVQLGNITSVNAFNSLKINLFYKNFNTVVVLDNRLAEIFKIDFNITTPYKNISHVSTGYDNTLWVFNQDLQQLELYDYKTNKVKATTLPVQSNVIDLKSNYNYCWLLTENYLYTYNYFGSLISKVKNNGYTALAEDNENIIVKGKEVLFFKIEDSENFIPIKIPKLLIKQFLLTNETLYIYDNEMLHKFQLKIK